MEHDLIRRSELLAKKCMVRGYLDTGSPCPSKVKAVPVDVIERAPAVDAAPVFHGKWKQRLNIVGRLVWDCSECDAMSFQHGLYCPNCGAKMDKGEDDG